MIVAIPRHLMALALLAGAGFAASVPANAAHEMDGRDIAGGMAIYARHCASCHGAGLEGQADWQTANADGTMPAPPHDETGHTWHHDNQLLFTYTRLGGAEYVKQRGITGFTSAMPAFGGTLSDAEIWDVLAFIRSTWPERVQEIQATRNLPHGG